MKRKLTFYRVFRFLEGIVFGMTDAVFTPEICPDAYEIFRDNSLDQIGALAVRVISSGSRCV